MALAKLLRPLFELGPGLILVLTWVGVGDIIGAAVGGSTFGLGLLWLLALAPLVRVFVVDQIARYVIFNKNKIGLIEGLRRVSPRYPILLMVATLFMGHLFGAYMFKGLGELTALLFEQKEMAQIYSIICIVGYSLYVGFKIELNIESMFKILVAVMTFSSVYLAINSSPDLSTLLAAQRPIPTQIQNKNFFLIVMGIIGSIGGSIVNFTYPHFLKKKGWLNPRDRFKQRLDLGISVLFMIIISGSIWIVGDFLFPNKSELINLEALFHALKSKIGTIGSTIFLTGTFAAIFSSLEGIRLGLPPLLQECREESGDLPIKMTLFWLVLSPLIWLLPFSPGFVILVFISNCFQVLLVPCLIFGIWSLTSQEQFMGSKKNGHFANFCFAIVFILAFVESLFAAHSIYLTISSG